MRRILFSRARTAWRWRSFSETKSLAEWKIDTPCLMPSQQTSHTGLSAARTLGGIAWRVSRASVGGELGRGSRLALNRAFSDQPSEGETTDEDESGAADVKKLDADADLLANADEEREGKELAEDFVRGASDDAIQFDSEDESEEDDAGTVSVLDQMMNVEDFLAKEDFHGESRQSGRSATLDQELGEEREDVPLAQLASERRRRLFWEYMESPNKKKHLLNEILLPKSLDEGEEVGMDKADMVNAADFADFLVDVRTSQKAVKAGAILRYRAMTVVGNFQGVVGFGLGKSSTIQGAIDKGRHLALKNLVAIPLYRQHTIYEAASAKVSATKAVLMWPRSRGFGIVANPILSGCCDLIGIRDISVKVIGSKNRFNMLKGFFAALESIRSALEIAEEKGVYMREVCLFRPPRTLKMM